MPATTTIADHEPSPTPFSTRIITFAMQIATLLTRTLAPLIELRDSGSPLVVLVELRAHSAGRGKF